MSKPEPIMNSFPTRTYELDQLRLSIGHRLQLDVPGRNSPVAARLLGFLKGETVLVKPPSSVFSGAHAVREGDTLEVRGFSGRVAFTFESTVEKIRFSPYAYCHLLFPESVQGTEIRHAERVRVNLPVKVTGGGEAGGAGLEATIANISINGAMLISPQPLGQVGDRVSLTFRFWILPNDYEVNLQVSSVIKTVSAVGPVDTHYGVRFESLRSSEAILLQNLIYQRLQENPETNI